MNVKRAAIVDRCGVAVSTVCAVHCVAMPLAFGGLLAAPVGMLRGETAEALLLALALPLGLASLIRAYRSHRGMRCAAAFATGLLLLVAGETVLHGGFGVVSAASGALCLAAAHVAHLRLCRSCPDCGGRG